MKKIISIFILTILAIGQNAEAQSLSSILNKIKDTATADSTSSSQSSAASGLGSVLGSVLGNVLGTSDIDLDKLVGTWAYSSPAVTLESENALQKIGGSAACGVIEGKLEPYYQKSGITKLVMTVNEDHSFTMKLKRGSLSGTIEKDEENNLIFNFQAFKKIKIGQMKPMASIAGNTLTLTFDVSSLQKLLTTVAAVSGNATLASVSSLLNSYDGLYAGFKLAKQ